MTEKPVTIKRYYHGIFVTAVTYFAVSLFLNLMIPVLMPDTDPMTHAMDLPVTWLVFLFCAVIGAISGAFARRPFSPEGTVKIAVFSAFALYTVLSLVINSVVVWFNVTNVWGLRAILILVGYSLLTGAGVPILNGVNRTLAAVYAFLLSEGAFFWIFLSAKEYADAMLRILWLGGLAVVYWGVCAFLLIRRLRREEKERASSPYEKQF